MKGLRWPLRRVCAALCLVVATGSASAQTDAGPIQQTIPFFAPFGNTVNSVVSITANRPGGVFSIGSGSIIGKHIVNGEQWLCVLTADHVANTAGDSGPKMIGMGDGFTQLGGSPVRLFGDNANVIRRGQLPVAQGGLGGVDIAVIGVRVPAGDPAFGLITPLSMVPVTAATLVTNNQQFSEMGYGGTGNFAAGGMQGAQADGNKRFQNNRIERTEAVNDGTYTYTAVQWDMTKAAAPGNPTPFLVAEGLSYGGDSGGPYFMNTNSTQSTFVSAFNRDGPNDPANWTGGSMDFYSNGIFAVHTRGNSSPAALNKYTQYIAGNPDPNNWSWGSGVPLTQAYINWIELQCDLIPAPGGMSVLVLVGIAAYRRRRD